MLEIGCGIGVDTLEFCKEGALVDALDSSRNSLEMTVDRCYQYIARGLLVWDEDAEEYLPDKIYDLIYSFGVLHHTPHPEKVLKLAHARLDDWGELRIMLYARHSWKHFWRIQPEAQAGCPLVRWYSAREARKLLESCGFRVVSIQKTHIFPYRVKDYIKHRFVKAFPWNVTPKWLFRWLESKIGHHLLIVAVKA